MILQTKTLEKLRRCVKKYLIDVNLPRYFSLWSNDECEHVININDDTKTAKSGFMQNRNS
jgi:hypothetical protein